MKISNNPETGGGKYRSRSWENAQRGQAATRIAPTLNPNPLLVGDYDTHNIRDAGLRLLLPDVGFSEAKSGCASSYGWYTCSRQRPGGG